MKYTGAASGGTKHTGAATSTDKKIAITVDDGRWYEKKANEILASPAAQQFGQQVAVTNPPPILDGRSFHG